MSCFSFPRGLRNTLTLPTTPVSAPDSRSASFPFVRSRMQANGRPEAQNNSIYLVSGSNWPSGRHFSGGFLRQSPPRDDQQRAETLFEGKSAVNVPVVGSLVRFLTFLAPGRRVTPLLTSGTKSEKEREREKESDVMTKDVRAPRRSLLPLMA